MSKSSSSTGFPAAPAERSQAAVVIAPDRTQIAVYLPDGRKFSYRARTGEHYGEEHLDIALRFALEFSSAPPGQRVSIRRVELGRLKIFTYISVGPPTWALPKIELARTTDRPGVSLMIGWLRRSVAVKIQRALAVEAATPPEPTEGPRS